MEQKRLTLLTKEGCPKIEVRTHGEYGENYVFCISNKEIVVIDDSVRFRIMQGFIAVLVQGGYTPYSFKNRRKIKVEVSKKEFAVKLKIISQDAIKQAERV